MKQKSTQGRLGRMGQILKLFLEKEKVSTTTLSSTFQTTKRTIQRDLSILKQCGYPLAEVGPGVYKLDKGILKNLEVFDENELAYIIALKCAVSRLGEPFQGAADALFNRLYQAVTSEPVFIHMDESVPLDARLMNRLLKAIRGRRCIRFYYVSVNPHTASIDPYKVVHFDGFWYLIGKEHGTGIVKRYAVDKVKDLKVLSSCYARVPANLDDLLRESANIWFTAERNIEVVVEVNKKAADYFRRRKIFPTQEIVKEKPDGSLTVSFKIGKYEEIREILKSWLPNIRIVSPPEFRKGFLSEIKHWLKWQEAKPIT